MRVDLSQDELVILNAALYQYGEEEHKVLYEWERMRDLLPEDSGADKLVIIQQERCCEIEKLKSYILENIKHTWR